MPVDIGPYRVFQFLGQKNWTLLSMSIFCGILFGQTKTWPISMFTDVQYVLPVSHPVGKYRAVLSLNINMRNNDFQFSSTVVMIARCLGSRCTPSLSVGSSFRDINQKDCGPMRETISKRPGQVMPLS